MRLQPTAEHPNGLIDRLPQLGARGAYLKQGLRGKLRDRREYGQDLFEVRCWLGRGDG